MQSGVERLSLYLGAEAGFEPHLAGEDGSSHDILGDMLQQLGSHQQWDQHEECAHTDGLRKLRFSADSELACGEAGRSKFDVLLLCPGQIYAPHLGLHLYGGGLR